MSAIVNEAVVSGGVRRPSLLPPAETTLLFETASDPDPVARFLSEDAPALDWRADFLRSAALDEIFLGLESEGEEVPEEEIAISERDVTTTGSGFVSD